MATDPRVTGLQDPPHHELANVRPAGTPERQSRQAQWSLSDDLGVTTFNDAAQAQKDSAQTGVSAAGRYLDGTHAPHPVPQDGSPTDAAGWSSAALESLRLLAGQNEWPEPGTGRVSGGD